MNSQIGSDARRQTRLRRERRSAGTIELPFNEPHVEVTCPECGESFLVTIACGMPSDYSPTFGSCSNWECDGFLKFVHDGPVEQESRSMQMTFGDLGGESA